MKNYTAANIRNIGIFGHGGEGKTTLTEAMLFNAGLIERIGKVENGNTTTDYDPEEVKRTISINAALAPFEWKDVKVNIIDAPGFFDFYGEVTAAMALADAALIVVGAVSGPVVGTEKAMAMCKKSGKARMMVISGQGFLPVEGSSQAMTFGSSLCHVPLCRREEQIIRNYCLFWKKDNSGFYVEEFAGILQSKFK